MSDSRNTTSSPGGDGVELSVTQARAGVRRGVSKILVISTVLAVLALAVVWVATPHRVAWPTTATQPAAAAQPSR
jgi:hypothetical protein